MESDQGSFLFVPNDMSRKLLHGEEFLDGLSLSPLISVVLQW